MDNLHQNLTMTDEVIDSRYFTAVSIRLSEVSLIDFVEEAWSVVETGIRFIPGQHVQAICDHLQAVTRAESIDLVINCPPGMSKSRIVSVMWPAWVWTTAPDKRFLFASYEQQLATRDSVACRQLIASPWYQQRWGRHVQLKGDDNVKTKFVNQAGGWRMATTPRGRGTGEHPDYVVADDPHNVRQAESEIERQHVLNWWDRTMTTRGVSRKSRRVVVAQRLHERDLSGHILESRPWAVHLMIPMEFDPARDKPTPWWKDSRRAEGEPLCSDLIPLDEVARMKLVMGSKASGQLQQNPLPDEGAILSRSMFKTFEVDAASGESWSEE